MRRSFKLATVFTGAAALAGGFGPTALAAIPQPTAVHPDIGPARECLANNGGVSNWVHLYYPNDDHPAECIGGAGYENVSATIASFCPGNNNGTAYGSAQGAYVAFPFHAGQKRAPVSTYENIIGDFHVSGIKITNWTGDAKCG